MWLLYVIISPLNFGNACVSQVSPPLGGIHSRTTFGDTIMKHNIGGFHFYGGQMKVVKLYKSIAASKWWSRVFKVDFTTVLRIVLEKPLEEDI